MRIGVLEGHVFQIFGFFILACLAAAQEVPAMVGCYFVQPSGERAALVVLEQPVVAHQFSKNVHRGVFGVFPGRQSAPAKTKDRGSILPIKLSPGIGIPCPCPSNGLRRLCLTWRAHPVWSRRIHRLVRRKTRKNYILQCHRTVAEVGTSACRKRGLGGSGLAADRRNGKFRDAPGLFCQRCARSVPLAVYTPPPWVLHKC